MIYRFIRAEKANHDVRTMCRLLGVSRSGYYAWRSRPPSARTVADAELTRAIVRIHEGPDDSWALEDRYGEVWTILVTERARGRGLGSALLDEVDAELARRGIRDLMIGVMEGNDDARRLYERRGLVPGWRQLYRLAAAQR